MAEKRTLREEAKILRESGSYMKFTKAEAEAFLKKTYPKVAQAVIRLKNEGVEKYVISDLTYNDKAKFSPASAFKDRNKMISELRRQIEFLADDSTTVRGYREKKKNRDIKILQRVGVLPSTADVIAKYGYDYNDVKKAKTQLKRQMTSIAKSTDLKGIFEAYNRAKEISPISAMFNSEQVIKDLIETNIEIGNSGFNKETAKRFYPYVSDEEMDSIFKQYGGDPKTAHAMVSLRNEYIKNARE